MVDYSKKKLTNLGMAIDISIRLQEKSQMSHNTVENAAKNFQEFQRQCREMPQNTLELMKTYLETMVQFGNNADCLTYAQAVFSYPPRGGENDGNPALRAVLSILPEHKMGVKENEYTKARAIWLCEDYHVAWKKRVSANVLLQALQFVEASLEARKQPPEPTA